MRDERATASLIPPSFRPLQRRRTRAVVLTSLPPTTAPSACRAAPSSPSRAPGRAPGSARPRSNFVKIDPATHQLWLSLLAAQRRWQERQPTRPNSGILASSTASRTSCSPVSDAAQPAQTPTAQRAYSYSCKPRAGATPPRPTGPSAHSPISIRPAPRCASASLLHGEGVRRRGVRQGGRVGEGERGSSVGLLALVS